MTNRCVIANTQSGKKERKRERETETAGVLVENSCLGLKESRRLSILLLEREGDKKGRSKAERER